MIFTDEEKYDKRAKKNEKKNILFIFSYSSNGLILQQKISILKQFIKEFNDNNLYVISPFSNLKLVLPSAITQIQAKISAKNIKGIINKYHIDLIIPIDYDDEEKIFRKKRIKITTNVENFFSSYLELKQKQREIEKIMLAGGFGNIKKQDKQLIKKLINNGIKTSMTKKIDTAKAIIKKQSVFVNIVAIKDSFGNQIILDFFEEAVVDGKQLFCTLTNLSTEVMLKIRQMLNRITNKLLVTNYLYSIKFFVYNDEIYFDTLKYGICEESMFAIQSKQIAVASIMKKINDRVPVSNFLDKHQIVYAYDFINTQKMYFAKSIADVRNIFSNERTIQGNEKLAIFFKKKQMLYKPQFIRFHIANEFKLLKIDNFTIFENYLFVYLNNDEQNINLQLFFYTLIEKLAKKTGKKILLLVEKISPMLNFLTCADIVYIENINYCIKDIEDLLLKFKIKSAFLLQDYFDNKNDITNILLKNNIKVIGHKQQKNNQFEVNKKYWQIPSMNDFAKFCQKINIEYAPKILSQDYLLHYIGISDRYNNIYLITRSNEYFNEKINVNNFFLPNHLVDFRANKLSFSGLENVIDNIPFYGLFDVLFLYKKGQLYLNKFSIKNGVMMFFLSKEPSDLIYDIIVKSLTNETLNITNILNHFTSKDFLQKILFIETNNKIKSFVDTNENKIFSLYNKSL